MVGWDDVGFEEGAMVVVVREASGIEEEEEEEGALNQAIAKNSTKSKAAIHGPLLLR